MKVLQAYRFALDPTPRQQRALASHVGARRRLQLGPRPGEGAPGSPCPGRGCGGALDPPRLATGVEPAKAPRRPLVAGELEGSLRLRSGRTRPGPSERVQEPQG
ncbi:helix-turn-helix domain-containing protein [Thermaerobacter sp. FW80]|uniref:helix-turn-helix domain-containing protein n=1 Tax=Thermaerobacter sp. FW80 TaxID=2546351 RepID=UPI001FA9969E|nr:helix-turn-helix domain-containing protein [Thermaerobacter sp. FW80]